MGKIKNDHHFGKVLYVKSELNAPDNRWLELVQKKRIKINSPLSN